MKNTSTRITFLVSGDLLSQIVDGDKMRVRIGDRDFKLQVIETSSTSQTSHGMNLGTDIRIEAFEAHSP